MNESGLTAPFVKLLLIKKASCDLWFSAGGGLEKADRDGEPTRRKDDGKK